MRQYSILSKAWYAKKILENRDFVEEVTFGDYESDKTFELAMCWYNLKDSKPHAPRLEMFDDSFIALVEYRELFEHLAKFNNLNISPEQFCEILRQHGFEDKTPYISPYKD